MSHLKLFFNSKGDYCSPVPSDFDRVVNVDEKGEEHITYEKVDYSKIQASLGPCSMWSLRSLMNSGIDPDFGIRTGFNTRLAGLGALQSGIDSVVKIVESENKSE